MHHRKYCLDRVKWIIYSFEWVNFNTENFNFSAFFQAWKNNDQVRYFIDWGCTKCLRIGITWRTFRQFRECLRPAWSFWSLRMSRRFQRLCCHNCQMLACILVLTGERRPHTQIRSRSKFSSLRAGRCMLFRGIHLNFTIFSGFPLYGAASSCMQKGKYQQGMGWGSYASIHFSFWYDHWKHESLYYLPSCQCPAKLY